MGKFEGEFSRAGFGIVFHYLAEHLKPDAMDKDKFYQTVYKLVEDYFNSFSKKPNYLQMNSQLDASKLLELEDLKHYNNDRFKGMTIVRVADVSADKLVVY